MDSENAFSTLLSATPPSMTVVLETLLCCEKSVISRTTIRLPANAAADIAQPERIPKAQQMVTPRPAPALTPMILGDASLLARTL